MRNKQSMLHPTQEKSMMIMTKGDRWTPKCLRCRVSIEAPLFGICAKCKEVLEEEYRQSLLRQHALVVTPYSPPKRRRAGGMGLHIEAVEGE